jgi:hypothetical protein
LKFITSGKKYILRHQIGKGTEIQYYVLAIVVSNPALLMRLPYLPDNILTD